MLLLPNGPYTLEAVTKLAVSALFAQLAVPNNDPLNVPVKSPENDPVDDPIGTTSIPFGPFTFM
jgi:hypothetical protein